MHSLLNFQNVFRWIVGTAQASGGHSLSSVNINKNVMHLNLLLEGQGKTSSTIVSSP